MVVVLVVLVVLAAPMAMPEAVAEVVVEAEVEAAGLEEVAAEEVAEAVLEVDSTPVERPHITPYERFLSLQGVVNPLYYGVNRVYMGFTRENCPCKQFTMAISLPL